MQSLRIKASAKAGDKQILSETKKSSLIRIKLIIASYF